MSILMVCRCGKKLSLKDEYAGKRAKCPACGQISTIPTAPEGKTTPESPLPEETPVVHKTAPSLASQAVRPANAIVCETAGFGQHEGTKQVAEGTGKRKHTASWLVAVVAGVVAVATGISLVLVNSYKVSTLPTGEVVQETPSQNPTVSPRPGTPVVPEGTQSEEIPPRTVADTGPKPRETSPGNQPTPEPGSGPGKKQEKPGLAGVTTGSGDWPFARGTPEGTGVVEHAGPRTRPSVIWKYKSGGPKPAGALGSMTCTPVVHGGVVYWGSDDGKLYALQVANGKKVWERRVAEDPNSFQILGSAAVAGEHVFVGSFNGFECLERGSGKKVWDATPLFGFLGVFGSPVVAKKKVLFGYKLGLKCYDVSGSLEFSFTSPTNPATRIKGMVFGVVTTNGQHVFFGSDNGTVYSLRLEDGSKEWEFTPDLDLVRGTVALSRGEALICVRDALHSLDLITGKPRWKKAVDKDDFLRGPALGDDFIIVASDKGKVYRLARKDGAVQWTHDMMMTGVHPPIVGKDTVFFSIQHQIVALDLATGQRLWSCDVPAVTSSPPSLGGGMLLVSANDGALYALGQGKPQVVKSDPGVKPAARAAVDEETVGVLRKLEGHTDDVLCVAFSPDGRSILSGGKDKMVRLWDVASGREEGVFEGSSEEVQAVAFSPDGLSALSAARDGMIRLWDVKTRREVRRFQGHLGSIKCVAFSQDGRLALSGGAGAKNTDTGWKYDNTVRIWEVATGKELQRYSKQQGYVCCVACSPDGRRVLSGVMNNNSVDNRNDKELLHLWDTMTGQMIRSFAGHDRTVDTVAFSPDGRRAFSASSNACTLRVWDLDTGKEVRCQTNLSGLGSPSAAFTRDGRRVLWATYGDFSIWDLKTGNMLRRFGQGGTCVAASPNGRRAATASGRTVLVWGLPKY